jgi:hypothetical protein
VLETESLTLRSDLLTVIAIALVAYAVTNVLHEGLGHGGACVVLGGTPRMLSSIHFECEGEAIGSLAGRGVSAAGTIVNFVAAAMALVAFRATDAPMRPHAAYFLWLFTTLNLLMGAGYLLFSGIGNIGDWSDVASGTVPPAVWRPVMAVFGGALYFLFARQSARRLRALIGSDTLSMERSRRLTAPAYIAGGLLYCVSGLFNPVGPILIAISAAAASFGGTSGLLWLIRFVPDGSHSVSRIELNRSPAWIVAGGVVSLIFVAILGPGVRL